MLVIESALTLFSIELFSLDVKYAVVVIVSRIVRSELGVV